MESIRDMWKLVSDMSVNPEMSKLLRATQLFNLVKNPQSAYLYINNLLDSINEQSLGNETVVVTIDGKEVSLSDLLSSLRKVVNEELLQTKND